MNSLKLLKTLLTLTLLTQVITKSLTADSNGLAPVVTDLNSAHVSYSLEAKLPDLAEAYISSSPTDMQVDGKSYDCKSGLGAGGHFILMLPEQDLIIVTTAHNKSIGKTLANKSMHLLPAFVQ